MWVIRHFIIFWAWVLGMPFAEAYAGSLDFYFLSTMQPQVLYDKQPFLPVSPESPKAVLQYSHTLVGFAEIKTTHWRQGRLWIHGPALQEEYNLCPGELTSNADSSFFCTGVFVGPHHILTAAHCVEDLHCSDFVMVQNAREGFKKSGFDREQVFTCRRLKTLEAYDLALVETAEENSNAIVVNASNDPVSEEDVVFMLGHPLGLPLYWSQGKIQEIGRERLLARISAFEGNSGSPIFSRKTGSLIGILVEGEEDFEQQQGPHQCQRIKRCPSGACQGEVVSRLPSFLKRARHIPAGEELLFSTTNTAISRP